MKSITLKNNNLQIKLLNLLNDKLDANISYSIGGLRVKGKWVWTDTMQEIKIPLLWHKGQPDNWNGTENCLSVVKRNETRFNDIFCFTPAEHKNYIDKVHTLCEIFINDRA